MEREAVYGKASGAAHVGVIARRRDRRLLEVGLLQIRVAEVDLRAQPRGGVEREWWRRTGRRATRRTLSDLPFVASEAFSKMEPVRSAWVKLICAHSREEDGVEREAMD